MPVLDIEGERFEIPPEVAALLQAVSEERDTIRNALRIANNPEPINILFDGPPSHKSGRFVETELDNGRSIKSGEWSERKDGLWQLRITQLPTGK